MGRILASNKVAVKSSALRIVPRRVSRTGMGLRSHVVGLSHVWGGRPEVGGVRLERVIP